MRTFTIAIICALATLINIANAQNVSIQLTPQGVPIQIPAQGGSFSYLIDATNNGTTRLRATVWCLLTLPNGNPYGPVLGPVIVILNPGQTLSRQRTQNIPEGAPTGTYAFNAYIGVYPDTVWDSDSFYFEKLSTQPGGIELWSARYTGPANMNDKATSLAVDGGGNVYVTGYSIGSGTGYDYVTIKYDASGNQLWVAFYNGPGISNNDDWAYSLAVDNGSNVYVTGRSYGNGTGFDYATIKYDASGNQLWVARYNRQGNGGDEASSLAVDNNGNVYVTGWSTNSGTNSDYVTIKYDTFGNQLWVAFYNGPGNYIDKANSLALDEGGNVYVTGESAESQIYPYNYDYATIKYDTSGNQLWVSFYYGLVNGNDHATSLTVDDNGNSCVTGWSLGSGSSSNYDYATIKYHTNGNSFWEARYNGPGNDTDHATSLAMDSDGNVYVTGWSSGSGTSIDYATIKYNVFGNQLWVARYNGPGSGSDYAYSLDIDSNGNIYVTGESLGSGTSIDYATIKYNSSGQQQWEARYNWEGQDIASSLAVDSNGNVCVTGYSYGNGTDYATIKYSGGNVDNWLPVEATVLGQPLPQEYQLEQNYPNPFNPTTTIGYQLPTSGLVNLIVYDINGRKVITLIDGFREAGNHEITFDASNLPSGIYFYRIKSGDFIATEKMMLVK